MTTQGSDSSAKSTENGTARKADIAAKVDIAAKLAAFDDHWAPRRIARVNDYDIRAVKLLGSFVWHSHEDTDELFLVVSGTLTIRLRDVAGAGTGESAVVLGPGELYVVPRGVEHCPVAEEEVSAVLFEPTVTVNTGSTGGDRTRRPLEA
ncbi:cupin domain-containing protein [Streptomyces sp. NBC_00536]|uniref:cupin domain-containing protein n=1 Tax=Streptomyces sp. NBC_00536 TaxID=2975769 RepID=UPI002E8232DF|nr:cupin domain-containing protein [Streptomyces sp. NBC_00536]WUC78863.1 cupin domain-containing protein [Streptomyces sp. NBC_00536]